MAGGENVNLALDQHGGVGNGSSFVTGAKGGRRVSHVWQGVWDCLENAPAEGFVGWGDDFIGKAVDAKWTTTVSNSGTVAVNVQTGGAVRMSTDTGAADLADLALGVHWTVSNGWTVMRARVKQVSAITNRIIEVGFGDALAPAGGLQFSDPSVPTAVATNAAVFGYKDGSMTTYSAIAVNGGGTPQAVLGAAMPITVVPTTAYQTFTIEIDAFGNAYFILGEVNTGLTLVATIALAVAPTAILTPWVAIKNTSGAAHIQDVDMVSIHGTRV